MEKYYELANPKFKFEKLVIWQRAMVLGDEIDLLADKLPNKEKFNLASQIRRAADSVALNISEGSILQSNPEQSKFMGYSIRSLAEVVTCPHKMKNRKYIEHDQFSKHYLEAFNLMNMTVAFRKTLTR